ncbi:hypothetical protein GCM10009066_06850 [Halarchaeum salinum]|uniref:Uncharacterized protein n=1 Tax=Halarchaeum salinum TaxID=489912 RepID=A0AAV3S5M3_9EURY
MNDAVASITDEGVVGVAFALLGLCLAAYMHTLPIENVAAEKFYFTIGLGLLAFGVLGALYQRDVIGA